MSAQCAAAAEAAAADAATPAPELTKEEKRARAIQLLAKAMGRTPVADSSDESSDDGATAADGGGSAAGGGAATVLAQEMAKAKKKAAISAAAEKQRADEEVEFLRSLLASPSHDELTQTVRDRLSVLAVRRGEVTVAASNPRAAAAPAAAEAPPPPQRLRRALELLQDGDASAVAPEVLSEEFWRAALGGGRASDGLEPVEAAAAGWGDLAVPELALARMRDALDCRGYGALRPTAAQTSVFEAWAWPDFSGVAADIAWLREAAFALRTRGWPPAFVFVFDRVANRRPDFLWAPMEAALGTGCAMDPSVFCWIARVAGFNGDGGATAPVGGNFGMPHRDFTHLASTAADGSATVLSVWVPLCAVDADNGCMMVVPRQLDRHFEKRYAYAHMRPALKNDSDENMLEVRFDLQAARALAPLEAGSIVAWRGNVIHWGTCCAPDARVVAAARLRRLQFPEGGRAAAERRADAQPRRRARPAARRTARSRSSRAACSRTARGSTSATRRCPRGSSRRRA